MKAIALLLALCLLIPAAQAGKHKQKIGLPAAVSPAYVKECGDCHVAFPPQLLSARDWQSVMANLEKHYGDNAEIADKTRQEITDFLVRNADSRAYSAGANSARWPLPKLTETDWFRHEHRKIANTLWTDPQVRSASNCAACHSRAEQGSYREEELRMPGGARHGHW